MCTLNGEPRLAVLPPSSAQSSTSVRNCVPTQFGNVGSPAGMLLQCTVFFINPRSTPRRFCLLYSNQMRFCLQTDFVVCVSFFDHYVVSNEGYNTTCDVNIFISPLHSFCKRMEILEVHTMFAHLRSCLDFSDSHFVLWAKFPIRTEAGFVAR